MLRCSGSVAATAAAVAAATVVVAVAGDENDYQKNDPSTAVVTKCVTHNMCLLNIILF